MKENTSENKKELTNGFYVSHLYTKKVETKRRRLFFEFFNNTELRNPEGVLYLDLRAMFGIKIKLISVEMGVLMPQERVVFYLDVERYVAKFKKVGWYLHPTYAEAQTEEIMGECQNCGKFEDLMAFGKRIELMKKV